MNDVPHNPSPVPGGEKSALRESLLMTAAVVVLWAVLLWPAHQAGGWLGLEGLTWAAGLCLVPGWLVFAASGMYGVAASTTKQVGLGLAARMVFVLGGFLALRTARPEFGTWTFTVWLLVFYLATLAMETRWLMTGLQEPPEPAGSSSSSNDDDES